ncbi:DUF1285 domain-containing protein [Beijerinckia sp. L45]|uniref:DUF1285 domain-containing protein n=1 Tax=Beijerinckia sp. L45 TaxID=1641855 RepID=UPI00131E8878|nr:DUF1285 domain-containing protein [Beijerinckia sp. L45]
MTGDVEQEKNDAAAPPRLQSLIASIGAAKARGPAPVEQWHPPYCGVIDLRIASDGTWFYAGTPILRPALITLFAGILRKDPERYVLVTPVECVGIVVEDAPFIAVAMAEDQGSLVIGTNVGDEVRVGSDHPLRFALDEADGVKPYVHIRGDLWAKLTRSLALELLDRGETRMHEGAETFGVSAGGVFFPVAAADVASAA